MQVVSALDWRPNDRDGSALRRRIGTALRSLFIEAQHSAARMRPLWSLFGQGEPTRRAEAEAAFGPDLLLLLSSSGLVAEFDIDGDPWVRAQVCLLPAQLGDTSLFVASDFDWLTDDPQYVGGPGNATQTLIDAADITSSGTGLAIDVGTGSGAIAVLLARHCERTIATDLNPRALAFTELTAALNAVMIECRLTNYTDGIDELADLIVCNPPYVVGAPFPTVFRDSTSDSPSPAQLAQQFRAGLAPAGRSVQLASWIFAAGRDARTELLDALEDLADEADVLVVERAIVDPERYTPVWTDDAQEQEAWAQRLRDADVAAIATGLIDIEVPGDPDDDEQGAVDLATAVTEHAESLGVAMAAWRHRVAVLRQIDDLSSLAVRAAAFTTSTYDAGLSVAVDDPLGLSVYGPAAQIDQVVLGLLRACARPVPVGEAIAAVPMARTLGRSAAGSLVRRLVRAGLLTPCEAT